MKNHIRSVALVLIVFGNNFFSSAWAQGDVSGQGRYVDPPRVPRVYPPMACDEDQHGRWYYSIGRTVIALPMGPKYTAPPSAVPRPATLAYATNLPEPPNPRESVGCPGNPAPGTALNIAWFQSPFDTIGGTDLLPGLPVMADHIVLHSADNTLVAFPGFGTMTMMQFGVEDLRRKMCENAAFITEEGRPGLYRCRSARARAGDEADDSGGFFYTHQTEYATPKGELFNFYCYAGIRKFELAHCQIMYKLTTDIRISYDFSPFNHWPKGHAVPLDQIIAFDFMLRAYIFDALQPDYPWKN